MEDIGHEEEMRRGGRANLVILCDGLPVVDELHLEHLGNRNLDLGTLLVVNLLRQADTESSSAPVLTSKPDAALILPCTLT